MIGIRSGDVGTVEQAKRNFFSAQKILEAADKATVRVLSRFGAFVRQRAKTSIRKRKGVSKPGSPPSSHAGQLRDLMLFAYDAASRSVVIGPAKFKDGTAPALLEEGGETTIMRKRSGKSRRAFYRARPFMKPAFDAELAKMPPLWRDEIH